MTSEREATRSPEVAFGEGATMTKNREAGMALLSTLMVMMLMSALLIGFYAVIAADQQASGVNRDQTQAYAAAHAGLEKLTADVGAMFTGGNFSPIGGTGGGAL